MNQPIAYRDYLASREWALKREAVRARDPVNTCERCWGGPQDAVHHLTYAHLFDEPLEDLQGVCRPCHDYLSGLTNHDPGEVSGCASRQIGDCVCSQMNGEKRCRVCGVKFGRDLADPPWPISYRWG